MDKNQSPVVRKISKPQLTLSIIRKIRKLTDSVIVSYSGGKDSLVCLDYCCKHFKRVAILNFYFVKGLECEKKKINYAISRFGIDKDDVILWEDPTTTNCKRKGFMRPLPDTRIKRVAKLEDGYEYARKKTGIEWIVIGFKKNDGLFRRMTFKDYAKKYGDDKWCPPTHKIFPVADWTKAEILSYCNLHNIVVPSALGNSQSNGLFFNRLSLSWLKEKYPRDYETVMRQFPCARILTEIHPEMYPELYEHREEEQGQ